MLLRDIQISRSSHFVVGLRKIVSFTEDPKKSLNVLFVG